MINSLLRFRFSLAIALATVGAAAVAQQSDQTVQQTQVGLEGTGTPIVRVWVDRKVSYADLDLTTTSGSAEFVRRVTEAAKEACAQVHGADPVDLSDMDDASCVSAATTGALKQAKLAMDQQHKATVQSSLSK
jgi:UrcA family protein